MLNQNIQGLKSKASEAFSELLQIAKETENVEIIAQVQQRSEQLDDPFMFVIVGEVKAGKSSFINALLYAKEEICKTAPSPMTDTIQQIRYGTEYREKDINPYLKHIFHPAEILKDISIVDTPGTNTIIDHHQEITESFIPSSDLIVFVFESKNPYRQSAWEFFDYIHDQWRRKVLFVLQQKDLMNAGDLQINIDGVKKHAQEKGIEQPKVFAVSALMEQQNDPDSGYPALRTFIEQNITGGKAPILKISSHIDTGQAILDKILGGITLRKEQNISDRDFLTEIESTVQDQEDIALRQVEILVENLLAGYDKAALDTEKDLRESLSLGSVLRRSFQSIWSSNEKDKNWLNHLKERLEQKLNTELQSRLATSLNDLSDSIQQMALLIEVKIKNHRSILPLGHEIFSTIAQKRSDVINTLQDSFAKFIKEEDNFKSETLLSKHAPKGGDILKGGGMAVIGMIISSLTKVAILDITGYVLTAVGVVFAGISIGWNKRKIIARYRETIAEGRVKLEREIKQSLSDYAQDIKSKVLSNFSAFQTFVATEEQNIQAISESSERIKHSLQDIKSEIKAGT